MKHVIIVVVVMVSFLQGSRGQCIDGWREATFLNSAGSIIFEVSEGYIINFEMIGSCRTWELQGPYVIDSGGLFTIHEPSISLVIAGQCIGETAFLDILVPDFCGTDLSGGITTGAILIPPPLSGGDDDDDTSGNDDDDSDLGNQERLLSGRVPVIVWPTNDLLGVNFSMNPPRYHPRRKVQAIIIGAQAVWSSMPNTLIPENSLEVFVHDSDGHLAEEEYSLLYKPHPIRTYQWGYLIIETKLVGIPVVSFVAEINGQTIRNRYALQREPLPERKFGPVERNVTDRSTK